MHSNKTHSSEYRCCLDGAATCQLHWFTQQSLALQQDVAKPDSQYKEKQSISAFELWLELCRGKKRRPGMFLFYLFVFWSYPLHPVASLSPHWETFSYTSSFKNCHCRIKVILKILCCVCRGHYRRSEKWTFPSKCLPSSVVNSFKAVGEALLLTGGGRFVQNSKLLGFCVWALRLYCYAVTNMLPCIYTCKSGCVFVRKAECGLFPL